MMLPWRGKKYFKRQKRRSTVLGKDRAHVQTLAPTSVAFQVASSPIHTPPRAEETSYVAAVYTSMAPHGFVWG